MNAKTEERADTNEPAQTEGDGPSWQCKSYILIACRAGCSRAGLCAPSAALPGAGAPSPHAAPGLAVQLCFS